MMQEVLEKCNTVIEIKSLIGSSNAILQSDGLMLWFKIENIDPDDLILDFSGIENLSYSFLNASIGRMFLRHGVSADKAKFVIPECRRHFYEKIKAVIKNSIIKK